MATYKGIGYDTANAKYRTGTASDSIQFASELAAQDGLAVTGSATVSVNLTVTGDASIGGDLDVQGDIISRGAVNLVVEDNFIDLNFGNTTATSESGGITVSMNRNSGFTASTVTAFVAGIASTSNPTFTNTDATSSTLLAVADIVMITGATQQGNNGLYQVTDVDQASFPQTVTIAGIGTTAVDGSLPFCQNQFEAESGATASAMKIDLAVWAVADGTNNFLDDAGGNYAKGTFLTAYAGSGTGAVLSDFDGNGDYTVATSTLQSAYNGGATITTAGSTDIALTLANGDFTASGAGAVLLTPTGASSFTSGAALTLTAGNASTWSTGAGLLTIDGAGGVAVNGNAAEIDLTTSAVLDLNSGAGTWDASTLSLDSTDSTNITMTANDGGTKIFAISALNSGGGTGALEIDADGDLELNSSGAPIAIGNDNVAQNITLGAGGARTIAVGSATSTAVNIDGILMSLDSSDTTNFTMATNAAADKVLTIAATNAGSGEAQASITATDQMTVGDGTGTLVFDAGAVSESGMTSFSMTPSGAITLTAGAASTWSTSAGALTLTGAAASTWSTSAGALTLTSASAATWSTTAGALELSGAGGVTVTSTGGTLTLNGTGQTVDLNSAALDIDASGAIAVDTSGNNDITVTAGTASTATGQAKIISSFPQLVKRIAAAAGGVSAGDVVYLDWDGVGSVLEAGKADADAIATARFGGVALETKTAGADTLIAVGGIVKVVTSDTSLTEATHVGQPVYVSLAAGKITPTAPTASGDVIFQVGICVGGSSTSWEVYIQPQFIMEIG